jgi:capsular exopolysaccharide synthesis family protein
MVKDSRALVSAEGNKLLQGSEGKLPDRTLDKQRSLNSFEEAIRMVRNSILLTDSDRRLRSLLFTSATPGEGKSTTALHLAMAHAEQGRSTLLIDADLRRPTLHKKLQMDMKNGLSNVLTGECDWQSVVTPVRDFDNLSILPAGPHSRRAADLVGSGISDILDQASRLYDLIIVDGPPLLGFAEPMQLAIATDGVVVIAVAGETNRKAIAASIGTLQRLKANVIGLVLNRTTKEHGAGYYYYYYQERYYKAA